MKAVIPLAGKGTRLRPHTHLTPKPLIRVAGKPVLDYILDDLLEVGVTEMVFIVGYLQSAVRAHIAERYPGIRAHYAVQEVQNGTAGAVALARPWINGDVLILFADTVFEVGLTVIRSLDPEKAGVIWTKEVEDYQRFGVVTTDNDGNLVRIVEKPSEPVSTLANIGLYYIRNHKLLFEGIDHTVASDPGAAGEYYLTDAFQYMADRGAKIATAPVAGWYDTGSPASLLEANRHLLSRRRSGVEEGAAVLESEVSPSSRIEAGAKVTRSRIGENVTVERGARVEESDLEDTIVGAGAEIGGSRLRHSIVGRCARVQGFDGGMSVPDHSEVLSGNQRVLQP